MSISFREELQCAKLKLDFPDEKAFVSPQWKWPQPTYLIWRLFWLLWHLAWPVVSGVHFADKRASSSDEGPKWFIYYAHITVLLTTVACLLDFLNVLVVTVCHPSSDTTLIQSASASKETIEHSKEVVFQGEFQVTDGFKQHPLPWNLKLEWLLYNCVFSSNVLVTIWFWAAQYNSHYYAIEIIFHVSSTVFVVSNVFVSKIPVRLLHLVFPAVYTAAYFLFTAIYYVADGTDYKGRDVIYGALDWSSADPTAITVIIGVLVIIPALHLAIFALYTFRIYLHGKLNSETYSPQHTAA